MNLSESGTEKTLRGMEQKVEWKGQWNGKHSWKEGGLERTASIGSGYEWNEWRSHRNSGYDGMQVH